MERKDQRDWRLPAFDCLCPTPIQWAQMAAYIDGEGSILINTHSAKGRISRGFYLRVTVSNTDIRLMVWLKENFGGTYKKANTEKYYENPKYKPCYHWGAAAHRGAWILHNCLPLFIIKREQAEIGIQLQESMKKFTRGLGKSVPFHLEEERAELKRQLSKMKLKGNQELKNRIDDSVTQLVTEE
jgi:hypothetical protein